MGEVNNPGRQVEPVSLNTCVILLKIMWFKTTNWKMNDDMFYFYI